MGGGSPPPYMYTHVREDERFPQTVFDPKAVTRASYEKKKPKPKPKGPLVSINRHPDAHMVPSQRSKFAMMGRKTKAMIKGTRMVQLVLRILELIAAIGLLVLCILIKGFEELTGWVLRVTLGVVIVHCIYSIYHHSKPVTGKTPGSSAAYQIFAGISDLCVLPLYTYGVLSTRNQGENWDTLLNDKSLMDYFRPSLYYGLIGAGGLHLISLVISLYLGLMFRRIASLPPDMNPLESNLTSRAHKKAKSSVSTYADEDDSRRGSTLEDRIRDSLPYDGAASSRPPSIPFMHTRQNSATSFGTRDSRLDLPSRQYQIPPSNRSSLNSQDLKRMSAPPPTSYRGASYTELPLGDNDDADLSLARPKSMYSTPPAEREGRLSNGAVQSHLTSPVQTTHPSTSPQPRSAKFTETWYTSDSLVSRTQERSRAVQAAVLSQGGNLPPQQRKTYQTLANPADGFGPDSDDDGDIYDENNGNGYDTNYRTTLGSPDKSLHPNPLRSNPSATSPPPAPPAHKRPFTPFSRLRASVLGDVNLNDRRVSGDITEPEQPSTSLQVPAFKAKDRQSSIQADAAFFSKPYGDLRAATPPIMIGNNNTANRQVSSGNDYDLGVGTGTTTKQRHVSGKDAEEGRAGAGTARWSRYSVLNE
ncbi:hypothetical protein QBC35DRAFT_526953 [Podospora australis]|uniref:Uncharacterized protein n=1 Tax=Podospora australis TaxID=1536484 RepID=A0AAN7ANJ5_9PEZI|nr:hypothetical protein QBC35DRAFT_526953 [Podospora australis]